MPKQTIYMDIYLHLCSNWGPTADFICHILKQNDVIQFNYYNYWITNLYAPRKWNYYFGNIMQKLTITSLYLDLIFPGGSKKQPTFSHAFFTCKFHLTKIQPSLRKTSTYPSVVCLSVIDKFRLRKNKKTVIHHIDGKTTASVEILWLVRATNPMLVNASLIWTARCLWSSSFPVKPFTSMTGILSDVLSISDTFNFRTDSSF